MTSLTECRKQLGVRFPRAAAACLCAFVGTGLLFLAITAAPAVSHNRRAAAPALFIASARYRSSRSRHKAIVYSTEQDQRRSLIDRGATLIDDYGSFAVLSVPDAFLQDTDTRSETGWSIRDDMDLILLRA